MTELFEHNDERAPNERPVLAVAPHSLVVIGAAGRGRAPLYCNATWDSPIHDARRAVVLIHGRLRNADAYYRLALRAAAAAKAQDTLLIVPQFLAAADVAAHRLAPGTLHWEWTDWMGGGNALGPVPLSSFEVLDAILAQLADRARFPALSQVVIAGHSGGGQVVQRYAAVVRGEAALAEREVRLRYVVANPSSYVYFDALRPQADGSFAPYDAHLCPGFNHWKYGLEEAPPYIGLDPASPRSMDEQRSALEAGYVRRDVVLLLGADDNDPAHPALDVSCAAQAQGPHRLARGRAYTAYMRLRHGSALRHGVHEIDGVGHDGQGIFCSAAGIAALFGA